MLLGVKAVHQAALRRHTLFLVQTTRRPAHARADPPGCMNSTPTPYPQYRSQALHGRVQCGLARVMVQRTGRIKLISPSCQREMCTYSHTR